MLRIYCDSNIYRYLNPKHPSFNPSLLNIFEELKDKMLFSFSDAHLDDLKDSLKEYIEPDLLLLGKYVKDNYFMHDLIRENATSPFLSTPLEAFNGKDYDAYKRVLNEPFNVDTLFSELGDNPFIDVIKNSLKSFLATPVSMLGAVNELDAKSTEIVNKIMPNGQDKMSIGDLMNNIWPYSKSLLEDEKEMTAFRSFIGSYLNRDEFSFEKWGMKFNERLKKSPIGKSFLAMVDDVLVKSQKNDLYHRFTHAYNFLELYNITQERSGKKLKKFDLENLNIDAQHAWYASFNDYLVTDDKGLQVKAAIIYHLFKIPTKILSSLDFINMKSILLGQEETYEKFAKSFVYDIEHSMQLHDRVNPLKGEVVKTFKTTHSYFNYFNRYQVVTDSVGTIFVFYCDRGSHADFFMYREIELIVNKMIGLFGLDDNQKGFYDFKEKDSYQSRETIRKWSIGNLVYSLMTSSVSWGTTVCLVIDFKNKKR